MKPSEFWARHPYVVFAAVVLVVVVVATVPSCARTEENSGRIDRLAGVQQQLVDDRRRNDARFARSDRLLCRELEKLKRRERRQVQEDHRNFDRNLRLLGVKKTPEIVEIEHRGYMLALEETRPLEGGCNKLPPPGG